MKRLGRNRYVEHAGLVIRAGKLLPQKDLSLALVCISPFLDWTSATA